MISLDTETSGVDFYHSAKPFFVTIAREDGTQTWWEWGVDPETREPEIPDNDLVEIAEASVLSSEELIGQNIKFDVGALSTTSYRFPYWPWDKTHDTLVAGHLLASNQPHDLTSMAMHYLGVDIEPYEKALEVACKDARRMVQQAQLRVKRHSAKLVPSLFGNESVEEDEPLARYRIAGPEQPDMPSAKEKSWKYDGWLPKALAKELNYYGGPSKVISGGQTGVDQAGLRAAKLLGLPTGGVAPRGWRTVVGSCPKLESYGLVEDASSDYLSRTLRNVQDSDGTLQVFDDRDSPGEKATLRFVRECGKPLFQVNLQNPPSVSEVQDWIKETGIRVLNVAGNSDKTCPGIGERAEAYLRKCLAPHPWQTVLRDYGNADSAVTLALWKVMREELHKRGLYSIYLEKLKNLAPVYDMQRVGVTVLVPALNRLETEYEGEYERMENRCVEIARGFDYDLTLPKGSANNKSLSTFLFETLKLPVRKWTETGRPSFDKDVIEDYKRTLEGTPLEFIKNLSGKRKRGKSLEFMTTYRRHGIRNGRADVLVLHSNLNPTATATTRFSCDNPNLQQCSKQETACELCEGEGCEECGYSGEDLHSVRQIFGPGPGREWWTADAENIELRIPAYRSGQKELIELFERPKDPPFYGSQHLLNFSVVYPDVWADALAKVGIDEVGPYVKKKCASDYYQWCKNGDFAIQYQCGEATADRAFHRSGAFRTLKSAFAQLESLNQYYVAFAEKYGYVETLPDRTVNPQHGYPLICARTEYGRILSTLPLNYMSQGTAGWWMVKAINRCGEQLKEWRTIGFDAWMVLTVHDELVFDFPSGDKRNLPKMRRLQQLMEQGGEDIGVPTPVSVSYHPRNWAEKVKL